MMNPSCMVTTSDEDKYSSPMPVIGLYIAASTLVCALFMICDIFHGLRRKKLWIPCRFFSLNSLTFTLLAIASKLPVDLTTSMPSTQDQLSKLSGSALICISMSFFSISLTTQGDSERLSNMISLTIFVVTIVVNIVVQMVTHVISSFILEHVIIMSCMLLFLAMMWYTFEIYIPRNHFPYSAIGELKNINDPLNFERKCMIHRLKSVYISSYENNPELKFLDSLVCLSMCMLSTICALVLLQAALKSLVLKEVMKFGCGVSNYKWSIWIVVVTQILTVIIGCIATVYRWFFSIKIIANEMTKERNFYFCFPSSILSTLSKLHIISFFKISRKGFMFIFQTTKRSVITVMAIVTMFICILASILSFMFYMLKFCYEKLRNGEGTFHMERKQWIQRNCEEDVKKWIENDKKYSSTHLIQLLSKIPPSQESLTNQIPITSNEKVSTLLLVVLIIVATIALPNSLTTSLIHSLDEAFEIIYFVDKKMNANKRKCAVAKELWMNRENSYHWFQRRFIRPSVKKICACEFKKAMDVELQSQSDLDLSCALEIIEELKMTWDKITCYLFVEVELAGSEIDTVYELIIGKESRQAYISIDELYGRMEQLFVDMLHFFLSQIPLVIFKHLVESPIQEYEERTRCAVKFLCKLEQLEDKVHWVFPDGTGITSLTTPRIPSIDTQRLEPMESNADEIALSQVIEDNEIEEIEHHGI